MKFFAMVITVLVLGCASTPPQESELQAAIDSNNRTSELDRALRDLENENYTAASTALERLAKKDPASEMDMVILYNLGVSKEGLGQCPQAAEHYRSVARISNKKFLRVEALALYRLGFVFECMNQPQKSIVAFLDARKRKKYLPPEVADAELPARLAAGYASIGRRKEALEYFNEASAGLKRVLARAQGKSKSKDFVARTLLAMGKISDGQEPMIFLRTLSMQQPFLLQAAELGTRIESRRASRELVDAYSNILDVQTLQNKKLNHRSYYIEGLKVTRELQRLRLPETEGFTREIFQKADQVEQELESRLAKLSSGLPKTAEELKRDSLRKSP